MTYDAIVVGARAAGSSTAMQLSRAGLSVLVIDRDVFPSDTLSTHQVQVPGVARLDRWGLLDAVKAAGTPGAHRLRFDQGAVVLEGAFPALDGVDAVHSPRRTILDAILVQAARAAGAEVREHVSATDLEWEDDRVVGVRSRERNGRDQTERASIVIGADGRRSMVAERTRARITHETSARTVACYTYWEGVDLDGGEIYARPRRAVGAWPTNDGLTMTYVAWPIDEFDMFRADVEGNVLRTLDDAGDLGERVRAGRRAERYRATPETLNRVHIPYGPGWALVGDAGLVMDPITGQGIGNAFRQAELLAAALVAGLGGARPIDRGLAGYHRARDREQLPMYEFTTDLAALAPPRLEAELLFSSLVGRQDEIDRFFGALTGSTPMRRYFSPSSLRRVLGVRGLAKVALGKARARRRDAQLESAVA